MIMYKNNHIENIQRRKEFDTMKDKFYSNDCIIQNLT